MELMFKNFMENLHMDKKFASLEEAERESFLSDAKDVGERVADEVFGKFDGIRDIDSVASYFGLTVKFENPSKFGALEVYGSYDHKSKLITIYSNEKPLDYLIAHEVFHHLEHERNIVYKFNLLQEISAHYFAIKLLKLIA